MKWLQQKRKIRNSRAYTIIELMVAVSLIGAVAGMLYMYQAKGWKIFTKSLSFAKLQVDARAALEQLARNLKRCSKDLIFIDTAFNTNVPLPEDAIYGRPYIYFAIPQSQEYKARGIRSKESTVGVPNYNYHLFYIAFAKNRDGLYLQDRALLRQVIIPNQDGEETLQRSSEWPFMPKEYYSSQKVTEVNGTILSGFPSTIQKQTLSNEFELYESFFNFGYFNTGSFDNLFRIRVKMVDTKTDTKIEYETAINPRN